MLTQYLCVDNPLIFTLSIHLIAMYRQTRNARYVDLSSHAKVFTIEVVVLGRVSFTANEAAEKTSSSFPGTGFSIFHIRTGRLYIAAL